MPPVPVAHLAIVLKAAIAFVIMGLTAMTAVTVIGFPNDYYNGLREFLLPPLECFLPAEVSLDYGQDYGQVEFQQLSENKPTPTLNLKISYAAPSNLHPTQTPTPPASLKVKDPFANTINAPVSSPFPKPLAPPPDGSMINPYLVWQQTMSAYIIERFYALNTMVSRVFEQRSWKIRGIVCAVICSFGLAAMAVILLRGWISRSCKRTEGNDLGQRRPSQEYVHPSNLTQLLEQLTTTIFENRRDPNHIVAMTGTILLRYFEDEYKRRSDWQVMVIRTTETRMKETLVKKKANINRIANREFRRLRDVHAAELKATYERDVHAAAERFVLTAAGKQAEQDARLAFAENRVRSGSGSRDISEPKIYDFIESDVESSSNKGKVKEEKSDVNDFSDYVSSKTYQEFAVPIAFRYRSDSDLEADPKWYEYLASLDKPDAEQDHSSVLDEVTSQEWEGEENTSFGDYGGLHDHSVPRTEGMEPMNEVVEGRRSTEDISQIERAKSPQNEDDIEAELQKPSTQDADDEAEHAKGPQEGDEVEAELQKPRTEDADDGPPPLPTMT